MIHLFSSNYLSRKPIEQSVHDFSELFPKEARVVDLGCGDKPYASYFSCTYIGVDPFPGAKADIVADAWKTPFQNDEFDGVVLNQSLEHIPETEKTITEIYRILKPGGYCLITAPQTMRNHTTPIKAEDAPVKNFDPKMLPYWTADYYRFTIFGLLYLCRNFQVKSITQTNSYPVTILQLWNHFFASFSIPYLFMPVYFLNNVTGLIINWLAALIGRIPHPLFRKLDFLIIRALPLDNIVLLQKPI